MTVLSQKQIEGALSPVLRKLIGKSRFKGVVPDIYVGSEGEEVVRIWIVTEEDRQKPIELSLFSKLSTAIRETFHKKGDDRLALISFGDPRRPLSEEERMGLTIR